MNIAESGIRERLNIDGYSPVRFAALAIRLVVAFAAFVSLSIGAKFVDFYFRFPDRALPSGIAAAFVRSLDIGSIGEMWLMYALFATLLAVIVNGLGWRERRPRLTSWLVRLGVFAALLLIVIAQESPAHFHASPFSYYAQIYMLTSAIIVGLVVESAKLGRRRDAVTQ